MGSSLHRCATPDLHAEEGARAQPRPFASMSDYDEVGKVAIGCLTVFLSQMALIWRCLHGIKLNQYSCLL